MMQQLIEKVDSMSARIPQASVENQDLGKQNDEADHDDGNSPPSDGE